MSGGGTFYNSDNLTLSAESILKLDGIEKVEKVYVSENLQTDLLMWTKMQPFKHFCIQNHQGLTLPMERV